MSEPNQTVCDGEISSDSQISVPSVGIGSISYISNCTTATAAFVAVWLRYWTWGEADWRKSMGIVHVCTLGTETDAKSGVSHPQRVQKHTQLFMTIRVTLYADIQILIV